MIDGMIADGAVEEVLAGLLLKVSLVLGAGAGSAFLLRRYSAALRHAVLVATMAVVVVLPALTLLLPSWTVPLFNSSPAPGGMVAPPSIPPATAVATGDEPAAAIEAPMFTPPSRDPEAPGPWRAALLGLWGLGAFLVLARFGLDVVRTSALARDAVPASPGSAVRAREIADRLGIRRPVRVVFSERLPVPATWGLRRPVVALPFEAVEWSADRLRIVLVHELAHVRRLDCLTFALAEMATALWWFHPLAWICRRRMRVEHEQACDDVVLMDGTRPDAYASLLVELARAIRPAGTPRAALAMARPSTLRDRVETILAPVSRRRHLGRRVALVLCLSALAVVLPLASVHLWGETMEARETTRRIAELADLDPRTREAAAWTLGARRSERAVEPLLGRLADRDARVRGVAARSLGKIGDPRAFDGLVGALRDDDSRVRELAILGLVEIPGEDAVAAVGPMLDDPEMGVRSVAVYALGQLGGRRAVDALARVALDDTDPHTRAMAISWMGHGEGREVGLPTLARLLSEANSDLRRSAVKALGAMGDDRAVDPLVARLAVEPDEEVRAQIIEALALFPEEGRAVDGLLIAIRDQTFEIRMSAAEALGGSGDPRAVPALLVALRDPVHQVRLMAAWALDEIEVGNGLP